jgi:hypothetical protein
MVPVEVTVSEPFDELHHREYAGLVRLAMAPHGHRGREKLDFAAAGGF